MSDFAPPDVIAGVDQQGAEALNPVATDAVLADFRAWLGEAKNAAVAADRLDADPLAAEFDVATVLQHFVALRQEVNLQTRASRAQLEQNAQTIEMLQESIGTLQRQAEASEESAQAEHDELVRPLLKSLIDAHDALTLAEREVRRLLEQAPPPPLAVEAPPEIKLRLPYWTRWLGLDAAIAAQLAPVRNWRARQMPAGADEMRERYRKSLDTLLVGYRMSRERIERALDQQGLEPISCVGEPFDPEVMEVAEVVREPGRTVTEVTQELRRGYRWQGRLFRCAQVCVARG